MKELSFFKTELLNGLSINGNNPIKVKLINNEVKILLIIEKNRIDLIGYYKISKEKRQGIARCALYFLLLQLLEESYISGNETIYVSSPTPDNGNLDRLIKIYIEMGFKRGEPEPGNPINLYSNVSNLISKLKKQCKNKDSYIFNKILKDNIKNNIINKKNSHRSRKNSKFIRKSKTKSATFNKSKKSKSKTKKAKSYS